MEKFTETLVQYNEANRLWDVYAMYGDNDEIPKETRFWAAFVEKVEALEYAFKDFKDYGLSYFNVIELIEEHDELTHFSTEEEIRNYILQETLKWGEK